MTDVTPLLASSMSPDATRAAGAVSAVTAIVVALVVAAVVGACLFLLFRRGSIADRARRDAGADEPDRDQRR